MAKLKENKIKFTCFEVKKNNFGEIQPVSQRENN